MNPLNIGTSGWSDDHWSEPFNPDGLAAGDRLVHYAEQFSTLEINNSFYPSPAIEVVDHGRDAVPADFVLSAKASRCITHMKKLQDPHGTVPPFLLRIDQLAYRLGPDLFQLPPRWHVNPERRDACLGTCVHCAATRAHCPRTPTRWWWWVTTTAISACFI